MGTCAGGNAAGWRITHCNLHGHEGQAALLAMGEEACLQLQQPAFSGHMRWYCTRHHPGSGALPSHPPGPTAIPPAMMTTSLRWLSRAGNHQ